MLAGGVIGLSIPSKEPAAFEEDILLLGYSVNSLKSVTRSSDGCVTLIDGVMGASLSGRLLVSVVRGDDGRRPVGLDVVYGGPTKNELR